MRTLITRLLKGSVSSYEGRSNLNENSFLKNVFTTQWKRVTHCFSM
jgi:hypothetical protein